MKQLSYPIFTKRKYLQHLILSVVSIFAATLLAATPALATGVYELPNLAAGDRTWVVDKAQVLSRVTEGQISGALDKLAKETGNEVRVVTIRHLDYGETAQGFTDKLFEKWFPTKEAQANQTLLVLDSVTNTTGIRSGDRVKSNLPDEIAQSVASETVLVPLQQGDKYNEALIDASDRLTAVLSGQEDPGPPQVVTKIQVEGTFKTAEETDRGGSTVWVIGLLIAATVIPMATYYWYQSMGS